MSTFDLIRMDRVKQVTEVVGEHHVWVRGEKESIKLRFKIHRHSNSKYIADCDHRHKPDDGAEQDAGKMADTPEQALRIACGLTIPYCDPDEEPFPWARDSSW